MDAGEFCDDGDSARCSQCVVKPGFMCPDAVRDATAGALWLGARINTTTWTPFGVERCAQVEPMFFWAGSDKFALLPPAGFYTASTCAKMPVPFGYEMHNCELRSKRGCHHAQASVCAPTSVCEDTPDTDGAGFRCLCPSGMYAVQLDASKCSHRALQFAVRLLDTRPFVNTSAVDDVADSILEKLGDVRVIVNDDGVPVQRSSTVLAVQPQHALRTWELVLDVPLEFLRVDTLAAMHATVETQIHNAAAERNFTMLSEHGVRLQEVGTAPEAVESSGYEVLSYTWITDDPRGLGWEIRMRVSGHASRTRALYVSRRGPGNTLLGSNDAHVPCRVASAQPDACCLLHFAQTYSLVQHSQPITCNTTVHDLHGLLTGNLTANSSSAAWEAPSASDGDVDVLVFLKLEDIQRQFGIQAAYSDGFRLTWFVGVAEFTAHGAAVSIVAAHTMFEVDLATSFTTTMQTHATQTFAPAIDIQLTRVHDVQKARFFDFATFVVRMPAAQSALQFVEHDAIPPYSALVRIGFSQYDEGGALMQYPCADYDRSVYEHLQAANDCALQRPLCSPIVHTDGRLEYTFPLGVDALSPALALYDNATLLKQYIFFDFFVRMRNTNEGVVGLERMRTQSEISRQNLNVRCATTQLRVSLIDSIRFDIVGGLLRDPGELNTSVSYYRDLEHQTAPSTCDDRDSASMCLKSPALGLGSVTFLVLGDDAIFGRGSQMQSIRISSMFSMYFLSELKRIAVLNLIKQERAFELRVEGSFSSSTQLVPTDALLSLCPLQVVRNNYGCISRYEAEDGLLDFVTNSLTPLAPPTAANGSGYNASQHLLRAWTQQSSFGATDFALEAVQTHGRIVADEFGINDRYRRAFMLAPDLPWTRTEMQALNLSDTAIDVVRDTITFSVVTVDAALHDFDESVFASLELPASVPIACPQLAAHPYLQNLYVDVVATTLGLNRKLVTVQALTLQDDATGACHFRLTVDLPLQRAARARAQAAKLKMLLDDPASKISQRLARALAGTFADLARDTAVEFSSLDPLAFRGPGAVVVLDKAQLRRSAPVPGGSRVLLSASTGDTLSAAAMDRNASEFASGLSSRRYVNVNSADLMTRLVEESLSKDSSVEKIAPGKSSMTLVEMLMPLEIACLQNESLILERLGEYMSDALKRSSSASMSAITPTSFIVLEDLDCSKVASGAPGRRLLQQQPVSSFTEMVFTPTEEAAADPQQGEVVLSPTDVLYNLPAGLEFVSIEQVPSNRNGSFQVVDAWGGGRIPPAYVGPLVYYASSPSAYKVPEHFETLRILLLVCFIVALANTATVVLVTYQPFMYDSVKLADEPPQYYIHHNPALVSVAL